MKNRTGKEGKKTKEIVLWNALIELGRLKIGSGNGHFLTFFILDRWIEAREEEGWGGLIGYEIL